MPATVTGHGFGGRILTQKNHEIAVKGHYHSIGEELA